MMQIGNDKVVKIMLGSSTLFDDQSEWKELQGSSEVFKSYTMLYKINESEKYIDFVITGSIGKSSISNGAYFDVVDFKGIVDSLTNVDMAISGVSNGERGYESKVTGTVVSFEPIYGSVFMKDSMVSSNGNKAPFARVYYNNLV